MESGKLSRPSAYHSIQTHQYGFNNILMPERKDGHFRPETNKVRSEDLPVHVIKVHSPSYTYQFR
jgi:hypothetical protein